MIRYCIVENADEMGRRAADIFAEQIARKPESVLGLATGSTPLPLYAELVRRSRAGTLDFSRVRSVNLDEYVGLSPDHPQSYQYFMRENLFAHIPMKPGNAVLPDGLAEDLEGECRAYDRRIQDWGGVDLQLLGIGHNGHIGFNEPGPVFTLWTHVVQLAESTRTANARFFDGDPKKVPVQAITMGIGSIMSARKILLMAAGRDKAEALSQAFGGDVNPQVPASILQLHPDVTVIADRDAAARIELP